MTRCHKKLINKGVTPMIFEAVPKGHDNVANGFLLSSNQPNASKRVITYYLFGCNTCCVLLKRVLVDRIELAHKLYKQINVSRDSKAELRFHRDSFFSLLCAWFFMSRSQFPSQCQPAVRSAGNRWKQAFDSPK